MTPNLLITGSHRSGSTWVGKMLSLGSDTFYIDEPFNLKYKKNSPFNYWFEYVNHENQSKYMPYLNSEVKNGVFSYIKNINKAQNKSELKYRLLQNKALLLQNHLIFKDPIAIFSTEWLNQQMGLQPLILLRHPAAVVSSIMVQKWEHDFSQFLKQPYLMDDLLNVYKPQIEEYARTGKSPLQQNAFLWTLIHHAILQFKEKYSEWYFVKYEEVASNPILEFEKIYNYCGLKYSDGIKSKINQFCSKDNINENSANDPHTVNRYSAQSIDSWRNNLSQEEINTIWKITQPIAEQLGYNID